MRILEDDPVFDAGVGSMLTDDGEIEMDAIIVDGDTLDFGAVAGVNNIQNPISLARQVMHGSDVRASPPLMSVKLDYVQHCMLIGKGAMNYAKELGIPTIPMETLVTAQAREYYEKYKAYEVATGTLFNHQQVTHSTPSGCELYPRCMTPWGQWRSTSQAT